MYNRYLLDIISPYGDHGGTHPKLINFNYRWNGYKYWMVYSPYPKHDPKYENPVVMSSNDLVLWEYPNREIAKNILDSSSKDNKIYNSDPHLVYNAQEDWLEVWWRFVNDKDNIVIIYRRCSHDGINWSEKEIILYSNNRKMYDFVSPSILIIEGIYYIYYVHRRKIHLITMKNVGNNNIFAISKPTVLDIVDYESWPWHIDVIMFKQNIIIIYCGYLKKNGWPKSYPMNLYCSCSHSPMVGFSYPECILKPGEGNTPDNFSLYRSSIIFQDDRFILLYSAFAKDDSTNLLLHEIEKLPLKYNSEITGERTMRNIAALGIATSSSISQYSYSIDEAQNALTGFCPDGYAFHTLNEQNPWWSVDMRKIYPLTCIIMHLRIYYEYDPEELAIFTSTDSFKWEKIEQPIQKLDDATLKVDLNYKHIRFIRISLLKKASFYFRQIEIMYDDRIIPFYHLNLTFNKNVSERVLDSLKKQHYEKPEIDIALKTVGSLDSVLELGASQGIMSNMIISLCKPVSYVAVEANIDMIKIMEANHKLNSINNCEIIHGVASHNPKGFLDFYINKNCWSSSLSPFNNPIRVDKVKEYNLNELLNKHKVNYLICDIEGGEYDLFIEQMNFDNITKILIELHENSIEKMKDIYDFILSKGFKTEMPQPSEIKIYHLYFTKHQ